MSQEQDKSFFKNFTIVLIVLGVLMATFMALGVLFGGGETTSEEAMENTAPVGKMQMQGDEPEAQVMEDSTDIPAAEESTTMEENTATVATGSDDAGKATYNSICVACHGSGIPGIPQLGDAAAWAPRITQGNDTLYEHAIVGYTGASGMPMPAKGGNPSLSDDAVKAAVDYIVTSSQ